MGNIITHPARSVWAKVTSSTGHIGVRTAILILLASIAQAGNLYVVNTNFGDNCPVGVSQYGGISFIAGSGSYGPIAPDALKWPVAATFGPDGNFYIVNGFYNQVLRYEPSGGTLLGVFVSSGLNYPIDLAFGPDNNLYVSNYSSSNVQEYNGKTGALIATFVSAGTGGLTNAYGLRFGPDGNLYVGSYGTQQILRFGGPLSNQPGSFLGVVAAVPSMSGVPGGPSGLVFGPDGNLYVASYLENTIYQIVNPTGSSPSENVFTSNSGANDLTLPSGMTFGENGDLYVASYGSNEVLEYVGATGQFLKAAVPSGYGGICQPTFITFGPDQNYPGDNPLFYYYLFIG